MSGPEKVLALNAFKGLHSSIHASLIEDSELAELVNLDIGLGGELTKRPGFTTLGTPFGAYGIMLGFFKTASFGYFIATSGGNIYRSSDAITWSLVDPGVSAEDMVQYVDVIYMPRNGTSIRKYDGTTFSTVASSPSGTQAVNFKDRLFVYNSYTNPSRLYFSGPTDFTSWPGTNWIDINAGDGDVISAIIAYQDRLIIFKTRTTWTLYVQGSPSNWVLRQQHSKIGCISWHTLQEIEGALYFLGIEGVYQTDGVDFKLISDPVSDAFSTRSINLATSIQQDYAFKLGNRYIIILRPDLAEPTIYVFNYKTAGWTKWDVTGSIRPTANVTVELDPPGKAVYLTDRNTGRVYRIKEDNTNQDNGSDYTVSLKTKEFTMESPTRLKRGKWAGLEAIGADSELAVDYILDGETVTGDVFELSDANYLYKLFGPGYFRTLQLYLTETSDNNLTLLKLYLALHMKRHMSISGAP